MEEHIKAVRVKKNDILYTYSDPIQAQRRAHAYLGKHATIYKSTKNDKKYMICDNGGHWVHFGQLGYEDFLKHKNPIRQKNYLRRSASILGDWKDNKYSPNNLSRNILW